MLDTRKQLIADLFSEEAMEATIRACDPEGWRFANLKPEYEREGRYGVVHKETGEHCYHKENKWNEDGTVLTCQECGLDGT